MSAPPLLNPALLGSEDNVTTNNTADSSLLTPNAAWLHGTRVISNVAGQIMTTPPLPAPTPIHSPQSTLALSKEILPSDTGLGSEISRIHAKLHPAAGAPFPHQWAHSSSSSSAGTDGLSPMKAANPSSEDTPTSVSLVAAAKFRREHNRGAQIIGANSKHKMVQYHQRGLESPAHSSIMEGSISLNHHPNGLPTLSPQKHQRQVQLTNCCPSIPGGPEQGANVHDDEDDECAASRLRGPPTPPPM